ncbi:MAG: hypothetical protein ACI9VR_000978 [Cognaticolwellia sp.]|jgi:hypothetical protein
MLLLALACAAPDSDPLATLGTSVLGEDAVVPDFELEDVNTTSASFGSFVGPSQYLERVSAWYFGHAT